MGSGNFWALAAPDDAALRAHFFLRGSLQGSLASFDENTAPSNGSRAGLLSPAIARHLVVTALSRESSHLSQYGPSLTNYMLCRRHVARKFLHCAAPHGCIVLYWERFLPGTLPAAHAERWCLRCDGRAS